MTSDLLLLPGLLAEIEEVAGRSAAVTIAICHGGTSKEFPAPQSMEGNADRYASNWLVETVGFEHALAIVSEIFPIGGRAEIPSARPALARQYVLENAGSLSGPEMAVVLGVGERCIRRIKQQLRQEGLLT